MHAHPTTEKVRPKLKLLVPTQRDLDIYQRVRLSRHPQRQVAADYSVHPSRICQIVRKVEIWLAAGGSPSDPKLRDALSQRCLAASHQKLRLQRAVELAMAALETAPPAAVKTRRRIVAGEEVWREESLAAAPPVNLYALQNYVTAVKALEGFERRQQLHEPNDAYVPPQTREDMVNLLCSLCSRAQAAGHVKPSRDTFGLVITTLQFLLGPNVAEHRTLPSEDRAQFEVKLSALSETSQFETQSGDETSSDGPA